MAEDPRPMTPAERTFRAHVNKGRFAAGVVAGEWRLVGDITWPHAIIAVRAAPREDAPDGYSFRFELTDYPGTAATAAVWNVNKKRLATAAERPKVNYSPSPFRTDWQGGVALYVPCDRIAADGHSDWHTTHADEFWDSKRGITKYLLYIHARLNEDAYTGL